tara:strand:+ start:2971 stop:3096 length:126 start_codon:yes stop_codon:yes gene_type:complete
MEEEALQVVEEKSSIIHFKFKKVTFNFNFNLKRRIEQTRVD